MFKNYFYLNRFSQKLKSELKNVKIYNAFTQEKNKIFLNISSDQFPNRHLEISTDQNLPYILIKKEHHRAKKNTINFFEDYLADKIVDVNIAERDRIIKIICENSQFYFLLRGNQTNFILNNSEQLVGFKNIDNKNKLLSELKNTIFTNDFTIPDLNFNSLEEIKKEYPFINKDIRNEYFARVNENYDLAPEILQETIKEINESNIYVYTDDIELKSYFRPSSYKILGKPQNLKEFSNSLEALQNYVISNYKLSRENELKRNISKIVKKELSRLSHKLNDLKIRIEAGSKEEDYKHKADLLLSNIYRLKSDIKEIGLEDYTTGENITIQLDKKLTPQQNIDKYYDKARNEKINYKKSKELFALARQDYEYFLDINEKLENVTDIKSLQDIQKKIVPQKKNNANMNENIKFRQYRINDKYNIFVGRDSQSNDLLSVKFAKQNDYWFHARGLPGSHVVLRVENKKEAVPKDVLKKAASVAAFYSKAKTAKVAPVAYTFGKYVTKKKGMAPGQVIVNKEKVLLVKPEIPNGCEYIEE